MNYVAMKMLIGDKRRHLARVPRPGPLVVFR
jgi:hypothetical protein